MRPKADNFSNHTPTGKINLKPTLLKAKSSQYSTPLSFQNRIKGWVLAFLCSFSFYLGPILLTLPAFLFLHYPKISLSILGIDIILILYPNKSWPHFRSLFQLWYEIFDFHHNVTPVRQKELLSNNSLSILAMHPHGIIPLHGFLWCAFCDQYLPGMYGVGGTTDVAQYMPVLRQMLSWLSATSAGKDVIRSAMEVDGKNFYILPGGVAEIFLSKRISRNKIDKVSGGESFTHVIKGRRRGLMKLALQTGATIIPVYVFGGTEFFDQLATFENSKQKKEKGNSNTSDGMVASFLGLLGKNMEYLSRRMKGGITFYWGQYGTPMPHATKVSMVLGDPIIPVPGTECEESTSNGKKLTCRKINNPTDEQIEELLSRYVDSLERLFEQYKDQAGYSNDILQVI